MILSPTANGAKARGAKGEYPRRASFTSRALTRRTKVEWKRGPHALEQRTVLRHSLGHSRCCQQPADREVVVTPASLSNLTLKFVTNAGVANSLIQKLDSTAQAEAAGDLSHKAQHIAVYLHELAQATGHFITPADAAILAGLASTL